MTRPHDETLDAEALPTEERGTGPMHPEPVEAPRYRLDYRSACDCEAGPYYPDGASAAGPPVCFSCRKPFERVEPPIAMRTVRPAPRPAPQHRAHLKVTNPHATIRLGDLAALFAAAELRIGSLAALDGLPAGLEVVAAGRVESGRPHKRRT